MDEVLQRDENHVTVLAGITDDSNQYVTMLRVDPTTKRLLVSGDGGGGGGGLFVQTEDATIANTTTTSNLATNGVGSPTLPADFLTAGRSIVISAEGYITNTGTPTLTASIAIGGTSVLTTGSLTMGTITGTTKFVFNCTIACRTAGVSGTVQAQGQFSYFTNSTTQVLSPIVNTTTSTINTTTTLATEVRIKWGTASVSNSITATNVSISYI